MSCHSQCHDVLCYDDKEHLCHNNNCVPERQILRKIKVFFEEVVHNGSGLSRFDCEEVLKEINKYV